MNTLAADIWPYILTAVLTAVGTYMGAIHQLKERVAVMENEMDNLQKRVDSHSGKIDDILDGINDIKVKIMEISTTLNIVKPE